MGQGRYHCHRCCYLRSQCLSRSPQCLSLIRILSQPNESFGRLRLAGLDPDLLYQVEGMGDFYGDELMHAGLITTSASTGKHEGAVRPAHDFDSELYLLKAR